MNANVAQDMFLMVITFELGDVGGAFCFNSGASATQNLLVT